MSNVVSQEFADKKAIRERAVDSEITPCGEYTVFVTARKESLDEPYGTNVYFVKRGGSA